MGGEGHSRTKRPSAWHQAWHPHCVPAAGAPPPRPGFWSPRTHSWEEKRTHCAKFRAGATSGSCHKGRSMRQEVGGLTGPRLSSQRRGEEEEEGEHVTWVYEWRQSWTGQQARFCATSFPGSLSGGKARTLLATWGLGLEPPAALLSSLACARDTSVRPEPLMVTCGLSVLPACNGQKCVRSVFLSSGLGASRGPGRGLLPGVCTVILPLEPPPEPFLLSHLLFQGRACARGWGW